MLLLHKGLIGSVLDYASVCYSVARVQYRDIRLALGLMCSNPNNSQLVLSGIPPLPERFVYLNFRYFVAVFYRLSHPLREKLRDLGTMNMSRFQCFVDVFNSVGFHYETWAIGAPWHSVGRCAYGKRTSWGSGYTVPAGTSQGALSCDIGLC
jgi:hypothetical protein